jgi:predicted metalloprotease with PDZ domain
MINQRSSTLIRRAVSIVAFTVCLGAAASAAPRKENIVSISDPNSHTLHVVTIIEGLHQPRLEVGIPSWSPGQYVSEDFARNISRLTFTDQSGKRLHHQKNCDSRWVIDTRGALCVKIEFDYTADQLATNKSKINSSYAILNGSNFLFYILDHEFDVPERITFKLPRGWRIATGLTPATEPDIFSAENYDVLIDCPILIGEFDLVTVSHHGLPYHLATAPKGVIAESSIKKLAEDNLRVIDAHTDMFGEIPYNQYLIINIFEGDQNLGGLEHLNSYVGIFPALTATSGAADELTSLTSHEFFHVYSVKRIRPAEMWPYRFNERNYTRLLWFSEGVTDYYTWRGLLRAGLKKPDEYLQSQANVLGPNRALEESTYISLEEASINTWLGGKAFGEGQAFSVDYYSRGHALGLLLDLSIRHDTRGAASLDDVFRFLYTVHYKKNRGFTTADLLLAIERLTKTDYHQFFEKYVAGTEPFPYEQVLAYVGLHLEENKRKVPRLGIWFLSNNTISEVTPASPAEAAGAKVGDTVLSVGNVSANNSNWLAEFRGGYCDKDGETTSMSVLREGKQISLSMKISLAENTSWTLKPSAEMTAQQRRLLEAWSTGR